MTSLVALAVLLVARSADAHQIGLSRGEYVVQGDVVNVELALARAELVEIVPACDSNGDGVVDAQELAAASSAIEQDVVRAIEVRGDARQCAASLVSAELVENDGVVVRSRYACEAAPRFVTIDVNVLASTRRGHRQIARARAPGVEDKDVVLDRDDARITIEIPSNGAPSPGVAPSSAPSVRGFVWMGAMHVLAGFDHLLFLFGLVLVGGRARSLAAVVTAFTVAHSITLALATLGVWSPSSRVVEPVIALSIAYVGVENFFVKNAEKRWRITFPFGLVHGFGFAGALAGVGITRANAGRALVAFNGGVELGQLAVLAVLLPALAFARNRGWLTERVVKIASAIVVAIGAAWLVLRVVNPERSP